MALACAALPLTPHTAHADTCTGLSLATLTPAAAGTTPNGVAVGDFDRDGQLDMAVVNRGSNNVSILLGDGSGGFTAATGSPIATTQPNPIDIAAGDLDQDGILDLVVAFTSVPQAQVLRGLGGPQAGQFAAVAPFNLATTATRIYLADFTRDADLDLVVLAESASPPRVLLYGGATGTTFGVALTNLDLTQPPFALTGEQPSGAAVLDFNRDGSLDLAVAMRNQNKVWVLFGNGFGGLAAAGTAAGVGNGPRDVAAGDVDRDGRPDLVTANSAASSASVLLNGGGVSLSPQTPVSVGGVPIRVALVDLDHDGVLDLATLDDSPTPRLSAFQGFKVGPAWFDSVAAAATLPAGGVRCLAVGRFTADGRADLVTSVATPGQAVVVQNRSGTPCARSSFAGAPRSYPSADGPVSTAAADFDRDGRQDLVVATATDRFIRILRNRDGDFVAVTSIGPFAIAQTPRAVATADLDADGDKDVVLTQSGGGPGQVQVYLGDGMGGLVAGGVQPAGTDTGALVIADFTSDGKPDVVVASAGTNQVIRFTGDGLGGLGMGALAFVGAAPRALVAVDLNIDGKLDVAVANSGSNDVRILFGDGDGTFVVGPLLAVGTSPQGIAAADLDGNGRPDLVTADNGSSQVSVILDNGAGGFLPALPYGVGTNPTAVTLLHLEGDPKPDIAVTTSSTMGAQTLTILRNTGTGSFVLSGDHPVRQSPQAITPIDADTDGLLDLAVPCRSADAVVILIHRPPGPPVLLAAPRSAVRDKPRAGVTVDLDGDGDLDLAVANSGDNSVSLMNGDGNGGLSEYTTFPAAAAEAVAAGDFNLDGKIDLAVSAPGTSRVELLFGSGGGVFAPQPPVSVGSLPDDLVAGDFDRDGDLDLAVCDKVAAGQVLILRNNGLGTFTAIAGPMVGDKPTAIVAADFDRDGDLDLAVAIDDLPNDVKVLANTGGTFTIVQALALLGGDTGPVSLAAADFDGNGMIDLAAAALDNDRLHVYRNAGASFDPTPGTFAVPYIVQFVTSADVNLDGKPDLVAVAGGLSIFRGRGGMDFDPPQTLVAGQGPAAAVVADFNRDGRPDVAVVNEGTDDVSRLLSTACAAQHLELSVQPAACQLGAPPFPVDAEAKAFDDGGNQAVCATNLVTPSIVPGTGGAGAVLGGGPLSLVAGVATWTGGTALSIDKPGRRYRLQFQASGLAPVHSRSFTLGTDATVIAGPASVCPSSFGNYSLMPDPGYDSYSWSLDGAPHSFTPVALLSNPPIMLNQFHNLGVTARVDGCLVTPPNRMIYFGDLTSVTLTILGASTVCVDCIGGSAQAIETGGGIPVSRQWGYRTVSLGAITPIPGENGEFYILKGASFPGPGTYYVVVTTTPAACGPALVSTEWTVMVDNASLAGEVRHLAASSRGGPGPTSGENRLLWVNTAAPLDVRIRWNKAPDNTNNCLPPDSLSSPPNNPPLTDETNIMAPTANAKDSFLHLGLVPDTAYCYSVFVRTGGGWSPGRTVKARPFDATPGPVKWAYATGGTAVAPPTVSGDGILAMSNDRTVHALTRGSAGGVWPTNWMPAELNGVAHSRSPVVPFPLQLNGADNVLFVADDAGF